MDDFANDGGANTFASLLGWVPAVLLFSLTFLVCKLVIQLVFKNLSKESGTTTTPPKP